MRLRTVAGRVSALTAVVLLALTVLFAAAGAAMWDARAGLRAVGHDEGPRAVATADVRLALTDMDAQVANVLLTGREDGWLCDPDLDGSSCDPGRPRYTYDIRREDAQRAALQAASLAEGDAVRLRTVRSVLDGLHQYDQRVQAAMVLGGRAGHSPGVLPPDAAAEYRAATALLRDDLLPKANNLALAGAATVDAAYRDRHSAVVSGRYSVAVSGLAALAALAGLQVYLAVRFRRLISLCLVAAALGTAALTAVCASVLGGEADRLRAAKEDGFDPVLALARTRAVSRSLDSGRARYLLDPAGGDRHDQTYLEDSQKILYIPGVTDLEGYYAKLDGRGAPRAALPHYRSYQQNDRRVRELAAGGNPRAAARAHLDPEWTYLPHPSFREHDVALDGRVSHHEYVIVRAVSAGDRALKAWTWLLPGSALAIAALVVAGVWPRLSEYR